MADTIDAFAPPGPAGPPFDPEGVLHLSRRLDGLAGEWDAGFGRRQRAADDALSSWTGPLADEFGQRIGIEAARSRNLVAALRAEAGAWSHLALGLAGTGPSRVNSWAGAGPARTGVPGGIGIGIGIGASRGAGSALGESRADVTALDLFVAAGVELRNELDPELVAVERLDDHIRAETGPLAVPGGAVNEGRQLLWVLEDHEYEVGNVAHRLLAADRAGATLVVVPPDRGGNGVDGPLASPWLAPNSDSRVVNLIRSLSGGEPSPGLWRGLAGDVRSVVAELGEVVAELGPTNQQRLALTDPGRFLANWGRAGQGSLATAGALFMAGAGVVALADPNGDQGWESLTGRRPGRELLEGMAAAVGLAIADPDALVRSQIGWDQMGSDPYRWLGTMAPELALEILAPGLMAARPRPRLLVGPAPTRGTAILDDLTPVVGSSVEPGPVAARELPDLAEFRRAEPEWEPAGPIASHRARPLEPPEGWVAELNGEGPHLPGRNVNCIDCTRAVESNWRGQDAVAAPLRGPGRGTSAQRLERWSGGQLTATSLDGVHTRLDELGPGSSAMIVSDWKGGSAHAYNAVNDGGTVKWVDAQLGEVSRWPPRYAHRVRGVYAIFMDPRGFPVQNLD